MQNLKKYRKAKGLTQEELAVMVEITASSISQYETGKKTPSFENALKIAEALDCEVADLISERENISPEDNKKTATENGDGENAQRTELKRLIDRLTDQEVSDFLSEVKKTILGQ